VRKDNFLLYLQFLSGESIQLQLGTCGTQKVVIGFVARTGILSGLANNALFTAKYRVGLKSSHYEHGIVS
jgi:hypothetical protein